jgi:hypothetical protein
MRFIVLVVPACGCLPFATPPTTASVGAVHDTASSSFAGVHTDVGFSPLQLSPSLHLRTWDATVSGSFERVGTRDTWGLAAAGGPVLYPWGADDADAIVRVLPQLVARWTTDGVGVAARVVIERADFTEGEVERKGLDAYAHGELAIGCYLEAGRQLDGIDEWSATIGLVLRLPAAVGLVVPDW